MAEPTRPQPTIKTNMGSGGDQAKGLGTWLCASIPRSEDTLLPPPAAMTGRAPRSPGRRGGGHGAIAARLARKLAVGAVADVRRSGDQHSARGLLEDVGGHLPEFL